ncbi:hypothetical protein HNP86_001835 [Methanococcus maripaludis]|uniref:VWFA domain-containing protein n=1 Tax=Methanococcus maripaludis TaxID=39152 RepID=A0A7J9P0W6_METMI|nr:vWA domain-containing protein [Methanococcus maripaludis]MBA2851676.1 hypothetical protein [Methanococcus maripaludis]
MAKCGISDGDLHEMFESGKLVKVLPQLIGVNFDSGSFPSNDEKMLSLYTPMFSYVTAGCKPDEIAAVLNQQLRPEEVSPPVVHSIIMATRPFTVVIEEADIVCMKLKYQVPMADVNRLKYIMIHEYGHVFLGHTTSPKPPCKCGDCPIHAILTDIHVDTWVGALLGSSINGFNATIKCRLNMLNALLEKFTDQRLNKKLSDITWLDLVPDCNLCKMQKQQNPKKPQQKGQSGECQEGEGDPSENQDGNGGQGSSGQNGQGNQQNQNQNGQNGQNPGQSGPAYEQLNADEKQLIKSHTQLNKTSHSSVIEAAKQKMKNTTDIISEKLNNSGKGSGIGGNEEVILEPQSYKELLATMFEKKLSRKKRTILPGKKFISTIWRKDMSPIYHIKTEEITDNIPDCILIDTSGSMTEQGIKSVLSKVMSYMGAYDLTEDDIRIFTFSGTLIEHKLDDILSGKLRIECGGTDLTPALDKLAEMDVLMDNFIVITDLYIDETDERNLINTEAFIFSINERNAYTFINRYKYENVAYIDCSID